METRPSDLNIPCIERAIGDDWQDSPDTRFCFDQRFMERNLREERDAIILAPWASRQFDLGSKNERDGEEGSANLARDLDSGAVIARTDIEELLAAMLRGDDLPRSAEYLDSCDRIAVMPATDNWTAADIKDWAIRLASDLSRFSD